MNFDAPRERNLNCEFAPLRTKQMLFPTLHVSMANPGNRVKSTTHRPYVAMLLLSASASPLLASAPLLVALVLPARQSLLQE